MSTAAQVSGHVGDSELGAALTGANVVVVPAGVPRKPGMTRDDLFNTNATIVHKLAKACAKFCPTASILVISNPVNSTVPIVAETLKREGNVFDKRRLFGVTTLDVVRARTFVGQLKGLDPSKLDIPVVGGHSGITILPLLSRIKGVTFTQEEIEQLTHRIQFGGDEVVQAKAGAGSATLSMAYAGALFTDSLLRGLAGQTVTECTYVQQADGTYFSCPTQIGKNGVEKINRDLGKLSAFESKVLGDMQGELQKNIDKGVQFVASQY
jgi:malate dehydrogenase